MGPGLVGLCGKSTCYLLGDLVPAASPVPYVPPRRWLPAHQAPRNPALHPPLHHQQLPQLPQAAASLPPAGWWQPQKIWLARTRACGSRVHHHLPDSPASSASRERTRLCVNNLVQFFAGAKKQGSTQPLVEPSLCSRQEHSVSKLFFNQVLQSRSSLEQALIAHLPATFDGRHMAALPGQNN